MTTTEEDPQDASGDQFAQYGRMAIFAPLLIGGAIVAGTIIMWQTHNRNMQMVEMSKIEEKARNELRYAYFEMRSLKPEKALERAENADKLIKSLNIKLAPDYAPLKISLLLVEAESLFMKDCAAHADQAEAKFDKALSLMGYASGEMWQFGVLGRARARFEQGKYPETLGDLDNVLRRNPSFGAAYYWRSLTRDRLGDLDGAKEDEKRARALDSWPPLRDFMQASCEWTRDIIHKPKFCEVDPTGPACEVPGQTGLKSRGPFLLPEPQELWDGEEEDESADEALGNESGE